MSFEGVRARTLTAWPAARQFLRTLRPVPPVAPKMATVGLVVAEDILKLLLCLYKMRELGFLWIFALLRFSTFEFGDLDERP